MADLFSAGDRSSGSFQEMTEEQRKDEAAYKYTTIFHTTLCEKLYQELSSLALGEFDIPGGQISPIMWTRLHEIYSDVERQTRKLPSGSKYALSSQMYANEAVQIASVLSLYTALAHEYDETSEVSLLSKLIVEDVEFRRIYALLLWSEKAICEQQYENGLAEKVRKLESTRSSRMSSIMALKRPTFGAGAPKDASVDPDAPGTKEDRDFEQSAMNVLFQLVRSGETSKAVNLATDLGMGAVGAQLQLHAMLRMPLEVPLEATKKNFGEHKRARRAKYFIMIQKLIEESKGAEDDSYWVLLSALRGNIAPMLKAGKSAIEKVWAYANSAFLARLLAAEGALSQDLISTLFNVPLTAKSILDELKTETDRTKEVLIMLRVVDDMLNDDIQDLYAFANETVGEYYPNDKNCEVNVLALDIFFHLIAVSYASGFEPNDDGNAIIVLGFDDLRARTGNMSHKSMAAFYSRFLPEEMKLQELVETMKMVDTEREREIFTEALKQSEINFGRCACTLTDVVRKEDESGIASLETQIDHWDWLLVGGEETALAALEECNRLIRKAMITDPTNESVIRKIIRRALKYDLPKTLSNAVSLKLGVLVKSSPISDDELAVIGGFKRNENASQFDSEASLRLRARAEQTLREDSLKKSALDHNSRVGMAQQHFDTVLPIFRGLVNNIGLRPEYFLSPRNNGDPMRAHRKEIQAIRNFFLSSFFTLLAELAGKLDKSLEFQEVITSFDDDFGLEQRMVYDIKKLVAKVNIKV
uniref:Nuclear pore complex protein n=1 Tax=Caenorhabditis tropicalis TaxID=1561998 RepID=A0A1I7TFB7_9PELO